MIKNTKQVGSSIRDLRRRQNMTGEELGRRAGFSQSKISKIETGSYAQLKLNEIKKILNILGAPNIISQQILSVINESQGNRRSLREFYLHNEKHLSTIYELERRSRLVRIYTAHAIPALLQTVEYRTISLQSKGFDDTKISLYIKDAQRRQDLLWDGNHTFAFIIPQTALYTFTGSKLVQRAQLDRLERVSGLPRIKLGIIPVKAGLTWAEHSSFALYDEHTLLQALARVELTSKDPEDIELHSKVFGLLERLACYDDEAIALIRRAMDYFS